MRPMPADAQDTTRRVLVSAVETPFGVFFLASRGGRFIASHGPAPGVSDALGWGAWHWGDVLPDEGAHADAHAQIEAYFAGTLRAFTLPLELEGSALCLAAWEAARAIPYGQARTYGEIAEEIGLPSRARAVGRAMAICPLPLLIPLHRVVAAGERRCGDLISWQRRMRLLTFERARAGTGSGRRTGRAARGSRWIRAWDG
jgi:methylated-DNA-[protein]-cysteine S-methyltransferase